MGRRLVIALALAAACGGRAPAPARPGEVAAGMGLLGEVAGAACDGQPLWCFAARGWDGGTAAPLPDGARVAVGLTIALEEGEPVAPAMDEVAVSVLSWRRQSGRLVGRIVELTPSSDEEKLETSEARRRIADVLEGRAPSAQLPPALAADLTGFPLRARYPLEPDGRGWILRARATAEIRRVGEFWVVIEVPPEGPRGVFLSVFTDRWARAQ